MCYNKICFNFFEYKFEGILSWIIIFISLIVNSIHFYFFYSILYHFNSIYILIVLVVKRFYELFIQIVTSDNFSLYFLILYLVLSTFVMISFAFFLEVIEIKLFGLNKNIKKNIIEREEYDEDSEDEDEKEKKKEKDKVKEKIMVELPQRYIVDMNSNDVANNEEG